MSRTRQQALVRSRIAAVAASAVIAVSAMVSPSAAQAQALPDVGQSSADLTSQFQDSLNAIPAQTRDQAWNTRAQLNSQVSSVLPQAQAAEFSRIVDQAIEAAFPGLIAERTAPAPAPAPAPAQPRINTGPCPATADACVDLAGGRTWLQDNGRITYGPVPQSPGKASTPTPTGTFQVTRKVKDEVSREFNNAPMPYATYFTNQGHAFHAGTLDSRSAGCVRMNTADAAHFFYNLNVGDTVFIY